MGQTQLDRYLQTQRELEMDDAERGRMDRYMIGWLSGCVSDAEWAEASGYAVESARGVRTGQEVAEDLS